MTEQTQIKRIYHPYYNWECFKAGVYSPAYKTINGREMYRDFLSKPLFFSATIERLFIEWPNSCEHFLTNHSINRVAWLGQASMCLHSGLSSFYRSGFTLLSEKQQKEANEIAKFYLEKWLNEYKAKSKKIH